MEHSKEQRRTKRKQWIYLFIHEKEEKSLPEGKKVASADVTDNKEKQVQEEEKQLFLFSPSGSIQLEAIFKSRNGYAKQVPFENPPQVQSDKKKNTQQSNGHSKEQRRTKENNGFIYLFMKRRRKSLPEGKKVASADVTDNKEKQVQEEEKQLFIFSPQR
ncbi:hypothetical protein CEXT_359551 [Caerostris extrusa]|uniref:Uncharacterized protein n=1 Tax=Caerostris extrusa TaxID=172846 RepID=A0AAV4QXF7_CAEEX|nr:hypothetical protein CEXT_359551 [Caerostris extrusa]